MKRVSRLSLVVGLLAAAHAATPPEKDSSRLWVRLQDQQGNPIAARVYVRSEKGEFLPSDVKELPSDLAADVNFNGVPAAFWNTKVSP